MVINSSPVAPRMPGFSSRNVHSVLPIASAVVPTGIQTLTPTAIAKCAEFTILLGLGAASVKMRRASYSSLFHLSNQPATYPTTNCRDPLQSE